MHAAGVRMCLDAIYQRSIETLNCAGCDHNWVKNYLRDENTAPLLPKGTNLKATAWCGGRRFSAKQSRGIAICLVRVSWHRSGGRIRSANSVQGVGGSARRLALVAGMAAAAHPAWEQVDM